MEIQLVRNPADESNIDPSEFFQVQQSADNKASIRLIKPIDFDVSSF